MTLWEWDEMLFLHDDPYTAEVNRTKVRRCFCMNLTAGQPSKKKPPSLCGFFCVLFAAAAKQRGLKRKATMTVKYEKKIWSEKFDPPPPFQVKMYFAISS